MEFPTSSSLTTSDTNSTPINTIQISFQLKQERISSPTPTPPTPVSPREPQSPDGHTSVSSTGSSDTVSDSRSASWPAAILKVKRVCPACARCRGDSALVISAPVPVRQLVAQDVMDVFKLEQAAIGSSISNCDVVSQCQQDDMPEVSFDVNSDFNLHFFDTPEDSSTQGGFSDPGSVESASVGSPPPVVFNKLLAQGGLQLHSERLLHSSPAPNNSITSSKASDQQFAAADSNSSNTVTKSFVPCKVCGDKASGYHYGVTSCEGCKGFFRRSIQKQIEYRCLRDGKCLVIRLNRNRCQYCRFKKCLSAGMSRDSVRYGRVPKRSRELNGTDDPNIRVSTPGTPNTPTTPQMCSVASPPDLGCTSQLSTDAEVPGTADLNVYDVIICVSQAHRSHCSYTEEQTRDLVRRPIPLPQTSISDECEMASSVAEALEQQKIWLWQQYATHITPGVQRVVEFAKRVPGFCDFTQDDQLILIKLGFFEVWLSHVARMITDSSLTFDDGTYMTRQQLEILYDNDFVISLLNFSNTLNGYNLSDTEIGLFSAMVLLASDRPGITELKVIARTRERIAEALRVQIVRSRPGSTTALQLMPALEAKIPELRALGAKHCSHLDWLRTNWTKLRLPPLFAEIFDIPKTEDDL